MTTRSVNGFIDWAKKSFGDHPVYTVCFGAVCVLGGIMIAGFIS